VAPGEFLRLLEQSEGDRLFNRASYIFTIFHMVGPFADALQGIVATRRKCSLATNQILALGVLETSVRNSQPAIYSLYGN
jgi:hypothetical protein